MIQKINPMVYRFGFVALLVSGLAVQSFAEDPDLQQRQDAIVVRAVERMKGFDYRSNEKVREAIDRHIRRVKGTSEFVKLVKRFRPQGIEELLVETLAGENQSVAVEAADLLLQTDSGRKTVRMLLKDENAPVGLIDVLGLLGNGRANNLLAEVASDSEKPFAPRRAAVGGLARSNNGQQTLIRLAKEKQLVPDTHLIAGALLSRSNNEAIRRDAAKLLPQPAQKDAKPLPPIDKLAAMQGSAANGLKLFRGTATCANCHIVDKYGKEVGPNLSEIGSKLSREAMLTAILAPSAGISHNYEQYTALTDSGQVIAGLKISETEQEVVIRTSDAIDRKLPAEEIVELKKSEQSLMPENLHHITGQSGLIDIIEYMVTLKKKG